MLRPSPVPPASVPRPASPTLWGRSMLRPSLPPTYFPLRSVATSRSRFMREM